MVQIFLNIISFIFIIGLGVFFRRRKLLGDEAIKALSIIIANITLPALILGKADTIHLNIDAFYLISLGTCANLFMLFLGYLRSYKRDPLMTGVYMMSFASQNLGNFTTPLVAILFPPARFVYIMLFDLGSSIMTMGFSYVITQSVINKDQKPTIRSVFRTISKSITLMVYLLVFLTSLFKIQIPSLVLNTAQMIGQANLFLPLFLIGLMMNFDISKSDYRDIFEIIFFRFFGNLLIVAFVFFCLPIPLLAKQIVTLGLLAPMANASPIYIRMLGYKGSVAANAASLGIPIAMLSLMVVSYFMV